MSFSKIHLQKSSFLPMSTTVYITENYTDKSFAVFGDTKSHIEKLKSLGGKFNKNLRGQVGWIFSSKTRDPKKIAKELGIQSDISTDYLSEMYSFDNSTLKTKIISGEIFPEIISQDFKEHWMRFFEFLSTGELEFKDIFEKQEKHLLNQFREEFATEIKGL